MLGVAGPVAWMVTPARMDGINIWDGMELITWMDDVE